MDVSRKIAKSKCGAKLPEDAVKAPFVAGCTNGDANLEKFCTCGWRQLRSVMSPAEIRMEGSALTPEFRQGMERVVKSCGKLKR